MAAVVGWDIGGVNTKVARVNGGAVMDVRSLPFELQHDPGALVQALLQLAGEAGASADDVHAVTMTAELSQMFRTKREGVQFVLDAVETAFRGSTIRVFAVDGRFLDVPEAANTPLLVAAANWAATARMVAQSVPNGLLIDIGTTSTDIIPISDGDVVAVGWTDPDRLGSGELVYTGAVRTPVEALAASVRLDGKDVGLAAEGFALSGDVHLWRGDLQPADYSAPTPDCRPATREFAGERLVRAICADREMVDESGVTAIADALAVAQTATIAAAIANVRARHPELQTAVVTGLGAFIAERAARQAGLNVVSLASALGDAAARCAPAASVALLLAGALSDPGRAEAFLGAVARSAKAAASADTRMQKRALYGAASGLVQTVVKIGGGLLAHEGCLDAVLNAIAGMERQETVLIVPGGGPFADAVRDQDARAPLSDDAAHWMAVLAMDQYAHLIASRLREARLVSDAEGMSAAHRAGEIPVLAPYAWLRRADPLPHSWDVTSDSIAAWVATAVQAGRLLLVKPPGSGDRADLVDGYFALARGNLSVDVIAADAFATTYQLPASQRSP